MRSTIEIRRVDLQAGLAGFTQQRSLRHPPLVLSGVWVLLAAFVAAQVPTPLWVDNQGRPVPDAKDAIALLLHAEDDGLDPASYDAATLALAAERLHRDPSGTAPAGFDRTLDAAMRRYLRDLHAGRVDPRSVGFAISAHAQEDMGARLRDAVRRHRVNELGAELRPQISKYAQLRAALARYRALAQDPALSLPPREPDEAWQARFLAAVGDMGPRDTLDDGLKRFQARHGLDPDGKVGRRTRAELMVPLSWRIRQIELAMERLRWLPDRDDSRLIIVNIPMFRLWAIDEQGAVFSSKVIVGRAPRTRTPVFVSSLEQVVFRPWWNVPESILRQEILPALARDPEYLRKHQMEWDGGRVRQRPGPGNSLGLIKFFFPNVHGVYLHGTPAHALFDRPRRDFSHGCIRVADPVGLAEWALAPSGWTRAGVSAATEGPATTAVTLPRSIRVVIFYVTAMPDADGRAMLFAEDIYGHDARLHRALERLCGSMT